MSKPWEAPRTRVTKRITGRLIQWRGKFGWIRPTDPIDHPEAGKRGGKVYIGQEDVEAEIQVKGVVSFITYLDETGLGAMHCRPAAEASADGKGQAGKGQAGKGQAAAARTGGVKGAPAPAKGGSNLPVLKTILKQSGPKGGAGKKGGMGALQNGEAKEERGPPPPPDKALRERLLQNRIEGKLIRWRGHTGWIRPNEPIDHPDAASFKKNIYLHETDVQNGHEMFQGAQVKFFLYTDGHGVGAEKCMLTTEQPTLYEEEPAPEQDVGKGARKGKGKVKDAGKGKGSDESKSLTTVEKLRLKRRRGKGKNAEDGEKREKRPGGPDLPRERVTDIPISGEVIEWKKKFGWLRPTEAFEHEKADVHEGKIYIHQKDVIPEGDLEVGQQAEFHIYIDANGLGAEECIVTG